MRGIKRLFLSITAQANRIVEDLENHEAVADAAIQEFATLYARVATQCKQQEAELQQIDRRIEDLRGEEKLWTQRAVASEAQDRARALECVRRLQATQLKLKHETQRRTERAGLLAELTQRRDAMSTQLEMLKQRKQQLAARQYQSDAQHFYSRAEVSTEGSMTEVFNRWETRLSASEALQPMTESVDTFAHEFSRLEEEQALQSTLDALLAKTKQQNPET